MRVKKINNDWQPSENPGLAVGDTIDITNPKQLILSGMVVAVDELGAEISSFELYGVITKDERKDFEEYLAVKKQEDLKKQLTTEKKELEKKVEEKVEEKKEEVKVEITEEIPWKKLTDMAREKGVYKVGLTRAKLEELVK